MKLIRENKRVFQFGVALTQKRGCSGALTPMNPRVPRHGSRPSAFQSGIIAARKGGPEAIVKGNGVAARAGNGARALQPAWRWRSGAGSGSSSHSNRDWTRKRTTARSTNLGGFCCSWESGELCRCISGHGITPNHDTPYGLANALVRRPVLRRLGNTKTRRAREDEADCIR